MNPKWKHVLIFLLLAFGISWLFWGIKILAQQDFLPSFFTLFGELGVFGPFIAYLIVLKRGNASLKRAIPHQLRKENNWKLMLFIGLHPFLISGLAYLMVVLFHGETFELGLSIQMIVPVALIILFVGGPIEEFGWRGYLQPLIRSSFPILITGTIVGLIHGLWHLPLHFIDGTVQFEIPIYEFVLITVLNGILYAQLQERSNSLRPMILLHWMANVSSAIFLYWTTTAGRMYLFGLTILINVGVYLYYRNKEKQPLQAK